jgi:hypothetical protein
VRGCVLKIDRLVRGVFEYIQYICKEPMFSEGRWSRSLQSGGWFYSDI